MDNREIALGYVRNFCAGDIQRLSDLLDDNFALRGPLAVFDSRREYLSGLEASPPEAGVCEVLSVTEGADDVSVFYRYTKKSGSMLIAQWFRIHKGKICESEIVFDTASMA